MNKLTALETFTYNDLTRRAQHLANVLIQNIEQATETWKLLAPMLKKVRDDRLYREEFRTFDEWLEKLNLKRRLADKLIAWKNVTDSLPEAMAENVPNVAIAQALYKLPETQRTAVLENVLASRNTVTVSSIQESTKQLNEFNEINKATQVPTKPVDKMGFPIPNEAMTAWDRRGEINDILQPLYKLRQMLTKAKLENHLIFSPVSQSIIDRLDMAISCARDGKLEIVCLNCEGNWKTTGCTICRGQGLVPERMANLCFSQSQFEMRKQTISQYQATL